MLENQDQQNLIYNFRVKTKALYNTSGWNSVYVAGKIIEKIGPILAINKRSLLICMLLKNLIKNIPKKAKIYCFGLSTIAKK